VPVLYFAQRRAFFRTHLAYDPAGLVQDIPWRRPFAAAMAAVCFAIIVPIA